MIPTSLPPLEGLHPIVVHFPIVLILFAPFLLVLGMIFRQNLKTWVLVAGMTLSCGTIGIYAAVETGEATAEYVETTEKVDAVIEAHSEIASQVLSIFAALSVVFWVCYFGSNIFITKISRSIRVLILGNVGIIYVAGLFLLLQTAHLGGVLVHVHGVHAPIGDFSSSTDLVAPE